MLRWFQRGKTQRTDGLYKYGNERLIELQDVVKTFDTAAGKFSALKSINLKVDDGEFVAIVGKSGSGKSTLINMVTGIDRPTSGAVYIGDTAVHELNEGQLAQWRGRNVGIIFQFFQLLPTLTVAENVMLPMDFCNMYPPRERRARAMRLLEQVEMAEHADKLPSATSGGQQQRVAIARALANDPPILVADEPTGNLDSRTAESVFELFENLVQQGKTIVMVTHDQDLAKRVSRTVVISDGQIIEQYLARVFPSLTEEQLVEVTREIEPRKYSPGQVILHEGDKVEKFYIIISGAVQVVIDQPQAGEIVVASMGPGQYFGEVELLHGGHSIASIRADVHHGVEVVELDDEAFKRLAAESSEMRANVDRVAHERARENLTARGRKVHHG
ncbi:MAG: ATP-binding cassette domain-containing protein [Anaerolineae bacterium]